MFCKHQNLKNACFNCLHEKVEAFKIAIEKLGGIDFLEDCRYEMKSNCNGEDEDNEIKTRGWDHPKMLLYREGIDELKELMNGNS